MIKLGILSDFSDSERAQLQEACVLVNKALIDPVFINELSQAVFDDTADTSAVIVPKLLAPMTITRLYCERLSWWATHVSKTIAFEEPDGTVTFNRAFFDQQSQVSLANTLFHEAAHVAGYSHSSSTDFASVPYQAGDLLESYLTWKDTVPTEVDQPASQPAPSPALTT